LAALAQSAVTEIYVIGRRGPVRGWFTTPELRGLGELECADLIIPPEELILDPESAADLETTADKTARENVALMHTLSTRPLQGNARRLHLIFLRSPIRLLGTDRVEAIELVRNALVRSEDGTLRPRPTGQTETISVGLVFRSIGYKGAPLPGAQFDDERGVIPNSGGHVSADGRLLPGEYAVGWIKRGPSGVIGSNRPDAVETAEAMIADAMQGDLLQPGHPSRADLAALLRSRGVRVVSFTDWQVLDRLEQNAGAALGRPRVKFSRVEDMLAALDSADLDTSE
jgi:ferredoxin--NADP+ reductase